MMWALLVTMCVPGQQLYAAAQEQKVTLGGTAAAPTLSGEGTTSPADFDVRAGTTVTVQCSTALPCDASHPITVSDAATGKTDAVAVGSPLGNAISFSVPGSSQRETADLSLQVSYNGVAAKPLLRLHGTRNTTGRKATEESSGASATLTDLIATDCPEMEFPRQADFVLRPDGTVLERNGRHLNESDDVSVIVYGNELLLPKLRVKRESAIRVPKLTNIFGANVEIPGKDALNRQALGEARCATKEYVLTDFAPGTALIDISAITDKGYVSTGKVEFTVATLFSGSFSLGAMRTTVAKPDYGFVFNGKDTVVTETGTRHSRLLYVLQYTPFVWGAEDLTLVGTQARVYPMFGVVLNDVANNALAGISVTLASRISLSWGIHAARVTGLDPQAGLQVGSQYSLARSAEVPTSKYWTFKPFYSVSIDLQAAGDLLRAALGTAVPGK